MKKITIEDAAAELAVLLDKYDWFYDLKIEKSSICVYVSHMGPHTAVIPYMMYGYHVKEAFAAYLVCGEKYGIEIPATKKKLDYNSFY